MNQTEALKIKNSLNKIKIIGESHSRRQEQVEDRISGLEDKIDIKIKKRRTLRQQTQKLQKKCTRNQQLHQKTKSENHGHQ
jgi:hypothetical protein